jgi:hypothetical protein
VHALLADAVLPRQIGGALSPKVTCADFTISLAVGWHTCGTWRSTGNRQAFLVTLVDTAPQAGYDSDLFAACRSLLNCPGRNTSMPDKSETYRVEGINAELRHYPARLARQSRCFSRCLWTPLPA